MNPIMAQTKDIMQPVFVYLGSIFTFVSAWFDNGLITGVKESLAIAVAIATLVYTIMLIIEKRRKLKSQSNDLKK